jgi:hypothetical protein
MPVADTKGLLKRASVVAGDIIPAGKETDKQIDIGNRGKTWPAGFPGIGVTADRGRLWLPTLRSQRKWLSFRYAN